MKDIIRTLIAVVAFVGLTAQGAVITANLTGVGTNKTQIYAGPFELQSVTVANPTLSAITVALFDSPNYSVTNVIGAFTNTTSTAVTVTNIYTNIFGALNTNIYAAVSNSATANAQITNLYRVLDTFTVAASTTVTRTFPQVGVFGILATNTLTNMTYTITLSPEK